jgi:hypothetical protein
MFVVALAGVVPAAQAEEKDAASAPLQVAEAKPQYVLNSLTVSCEGVADVSEKVGHTKTSREKQFEIFWENFTRQSGG